MIVMPQGIGKWPHNVLERKHLVDVASLVKVVHSERDPEWCVTENELYWKKHGKPHP